MATKTSNHDIINIDIFYGTQDFIIWKKIIFFYYGLKARVNKNRYGSIIDIENLKILKWHIIPYCYIYQIIRLCPMLVMLLTCGKN